MSKHETENGTMVDTPEVLQLGYDARFVGKVTRCNVIEGKEGKTIGLGYTLNGGGEWFNGALWFNGGAERKPLEVGEYAMVTFTTSRSKKGGQYVTRVNIESMQRIEVTVDVSIV